MTQMPSGGPPPQPPGQQSNIYTALVIIATLFVAVAAVYVGYKNYELFGTIFPPSGG